MYIVDAEQLKSDHSRTFKRQLLIVLTVSLGTFLTGSSIGWMSPALHRLQGNDTHIKITSEEGSWLALYPEIGHFCAPVLTGYFTDMIGRKVVFIAGGVFTLVGWFLKYVAGSLTMLYAARIMLGISFGITMTVSHIYVAEVVSKKIRGTFSSLLFVTLNLGIVFEFIIGSYLSFKASALITTIISGFYAISLFFLVESPYYYIAKHKEAQAQKSMVWFKGPFNEETIAEFNSMKKQITGQSLKFSQSSFKSFMLCMLLSFLSDTTGRPAVITYAMQNFSNDSWLSPTGFTILLGSLNACLPLIPTLLSDRVGRKVIIIVAAIVGGIMHFCTGTLYFLHDTKGCTIPAYGWLLFGTITAYLCSCSIFVTNVLTLRGELISENSRGMTSGLVSMMYALAIILTIKTFQLVRDNLGLHFAFWVLSVSSLIFVLFTSFFLPETKGKTLDEIQKQLGRSN